MESYFDQAWFCFTSVVNWMKSTTLLTVGGVDVTFLGLLLSCVAVNLIFGIIEFLLPGFQLTDSIGSAWEDEVDIRSEFGMSEDKYYRGRFSDNPYSNWRGFGD